MLILGGRYGSIEPESGKSYTQIEYEYAIEKDIPVFAVILNESFLHQKAALKAYDVFEKDNKDKYEEFKKLVETKIIKYVDDCKDIQIVIKDSISELDEEYELIGWIRSNEGDTGQLLQQLNETRLECDKLRDELKECKSNIANIKVVEIFASGEEKTTLRYTDMHTFNKFSTIELTWNEIFIIFGKIIYKDGSITNTEIKFELESAIANRYGDYSASVYDDDVIKVQIQLEKLCLIKRVNNSNFAFTESGREEFINQFVEKKK